MRRNFLWHSLSIPGAVLMGQKGSTKRIISLSVNLLAFCHWSVFCEAVSVAGLKVLTMNIFLYLQLSFLFFFLLASLESSLYWTKPIFPNGRLLSSDKLGCSRGIQICNTVKVKLYQLCVILEKTVHVPEQREYDKALEVFIRFERLCNSKRCWTVGR